MLRAVDTVDPPARGHTAVWGLRLSTDASDSDSLGGRWSVVSVARVARARELACSAGLRAAALRLILLLLSNLPAVAGRGPYALAPSAP